MNVLIKKDENGTKVKYLCNAYHLELLNLLTYRMCHIHIINILTSDFDTFTYINVFLKDLYLLTAPNYQSA